MNLLHLRHALRRYWRTVAATAVPIILAVALWLRANGDDAEQAVEAIAALVASRFGEKDA